MKLCGLKKSVSSQRGITIIEMLAYVILCAGFLTMAYRTVTVSSRGIMALQNNTFDIIRVTKAGERWRQDIRDAEMTPQVTHSSLPNPENEAEEVHVTYLQIVNSSHTVWYAFRENTVYRKDSRLPNYWEVVLEENVAASNMTSERRGQTVFWSWELELKTKYQDVLTRPLFSFISVPGKGLAP